MARSRVVLDTNVIYAGLRSRRGASFHILEFAGRGVFELALSVPLLLEYEAITSRLPAETSLTAEDVDTVIDFLASVAHLQDVYFGWRPTLPDPNDDFILELAVAANCSHIVTFNIKDFRGTEPFGVTVVTPASFLTLLRSQK
jgi:putative PIN family toxin of toxin-antitoxin system